jgi:hypothetical protein
MKRWWTTGEHRPVAYPHLWHNSFFDDYFLPTEFERVTRVEPYKIAGWLDVARNVSSTPQALRELESLNQFLRVDPDYEWQEGDPLATVKATFNHVREILRLSQRHGLPVIFWG